MTATTLTTDPDAGLYAAIRDCAALWRQTPALDELAVKMKRDGNAVEAAKANARTDEITGQACDLERQIAEMPVATVRGYGTKCDAIDRANFDASDLVAIAFLLGRDAERLGITGLPAFITNAG
jgi:hypothetical protein